MFRAKLIVLSMLAALALGAVGAASASAAEYGGFTGTETISGEGKAQVFESVIASAKVIINCEKNKGTGSLTASTGAGEGELTFETCSLSVVNGTTHAKEAQAVCTVANATSSIKGQLVAGNTRQTLEPKTGTVFAEIKITGASCTEKGTFKVEGKVSCAGPEGLVALEEHALNCNGASGDELKLGTQEARLTGTLGVKLSGANKGKTFYAV